MNRISWIIAEYLILFIGLPLFVYIYGFVLSPILFLLLIMAYVLFIYQRDPDKPSRLFFPMRRIKKRALYFVLQRFYLSTLLMIALILLFDERQLFSWPLHDTLLWLIVIIAYPLFSVIPQEILFRGFFFRRYKKIFPTKSVMILMNALTFSFAHIIFHNFWAVGLTFIGGIYFALTFYRFKSLKLVIIEHALYGVMLFTVGFGDYFYHGRVQF